MRHRSGNILPALLFAIVVIALSVLLLRARSSSEAAPATYAPAPVGDETALRLTPVLRASRLPDGAAVTVALVRDGASAVYYDDSTRYDRALDIWATALERTGARVRRVAPSELARDTSDVLVVAAAPCLTPATRSAMLGAASQRRGVIFTGLTGTRDAGCRSVGYGLLASLTRATRADTLPSGASPFVTVPAGSPLAMDVPPGARVELMPAPHVAVRQRGRDAYYSDRDLNPSTSGMDFVDGAVVHVLGDGRRVAYFGFELGTVVDRPWEHAIVDLLIRNAVALAAGVPLASPDAWPWGYRTAAVIAQDVEDEFANARHTVDSLNAAGAPGTFFLVSDLAGAHDDLVADMARLGEIGTHSESHAAFGGPVEVQRSRLERTQEQLSEMVGGPVLGLRPPEERFDVATLLAWRQAGGLYVFGATDGRSASPELVELDGGPFVLIGRTADDDFLTVRRAGITDPARLATDQLEAFEKSRALGGLYIMSYHSNMLSRPETAPAIGTVARRLRAERGVWLTTTADVAEWWLARHALDLSVAQSDSGALTVTARNTGKHPLPRSTVTVTLPRGARAVADSAPELRTPAGTARVALPRLPAGMTHTTVLTLAGATDAF